MIRHSWGSVLGLALALVTGQAVQQVAQRAFAEEPSARARGGWGEQSGAVDPASDWVASLRAEAERDD